MKHLYMEISIFIYVYYYQTLFDRTHKHIPFMMNNKTKNRSKNASTIRITQIRLPDSTSPPFTFEIWFEITSLRFFQNYPRLKSFPSASMTIILIPFMNIQIMCKLWILYLFQFLRINFNFLFRLKMRIKKMITQ